MSEQSKQPPISRRDFLKLLGAAGATKFFPGLTSQPVEAGEPPELTPRFEAMPRREILTDPLTFIDQVIKVLKQMARQQSNFDDDESAVRSVHSPSIQEFVQMFDDTTSNPKALENRKVIQTLFVEKFIGHRVDDVMTSIDQTLPNLNLAIAQQLVQLGWWWSPFNTILHKFNNFDPSDTYLNNFDFTNQQFKDMISWGKPLADIPPAEVDDYYMSQIDTTQLQANIDQVWDLLIKEGIAQEVEGGNRTNIDRQRFEQILAKITQYFPGAVAGIKHIDFNRRTHRAYNRLDRQGVFITDAFFELSQLLNDSREFANSHKWIMLNRLLHTFFHELAHDDEQNAVPRDDVMQLNPDKVVRLGEIQWSLHQDWMAGIIEKNEQTGEYALTVNDIQQIVLDPIGLYPLATDEILTQSDLVDFQNEITTVKEILEVISVENPTLFDDTGLSQLFADNNEDLALVWQYFTDQSLESAGNFISSLIIDPADLSWGDNNNFNGQRITDLHKFSMSQLDEMLVLAQELVNNPASHPVINSELSQALVTLKSIYQLVCYVAVARGKALYPKQISYGIGFRWENLVAIVHGQLSHIMVGPVGSYLRNGRSAYMMDQLPDQLVDRALSAGAENRKKVVYQNGQTTELTDYPEKPSQALLNLLELVYRKTAEMQTNRGFAWGANNNSFFRSVTRELAEQFGIQPEDTP